MNKIYFLLLSSQLFCQSFHIFPPLSPELFDPIVNLPPSLDEGAIPCFMTLSVKLPSLSLLLLPFQIPRLSLFRGGLAP